MFGVYRLLLAVAVVTQHLLTVPVIGDFGLHGFFVLSGFLMTRVLCETYGFAPAGVLAFALNRALRLYPMYWAAIAISALLIWLLGEDHAREYRSFLYLPRDWSSVVQNVTMIFPAWQPGLVEPRLSPPAWSLTVEIVFYVCMALGLSARPLLAGTWLVLSAAAWAVAAAGGQDADWFYGHVLAQSFPFAAGACLWHVHAAVSTGRLPVARVRLALAVGGVTAVHACAMALLVMVGFSAVRLCGDVVNIGLQAATVAVLAGWVAGPGMRARDRILGDLAYPVFLLHWPVAFAISRVLPGQPARGLNAGGFLVFVLAVALSAGLAWVLVRRIDVPIERLRSRVRPHGPSRRRRTRGSVQSAPLPPSSR